MLGASLATFVVVSAFVAFGSWPGANSGRELDQVVLREVAQPKAQRIAVRSDAVEIARRAQARRERAAAEQHGGETVGRTPAGGPLTQVPVAGTLPAATPTGPGGGGATTAPQVENVTQNIQETARDVTEGVQRGVTDVQTQVNEVVDQVVGGTQQTATGVTETANGLLGG